THMDMDHIGGLLNNGQPVYPNATLWVSAPEYAAWVEKGLGEGGVSGRSQAAVDLAKKVAAAYTVKRFNFGDEILPGVTAVDASGHTPGHTAYDIVSGADKMTIAGDILHIAPVQLARPELSTVYDMDGEKAAQARQRLLERASSERSLFAGMHFPMVSDVRKIPDNGYVMKQPR
ncbi:MAG: MBL fold metallo-hydrolase, partial [Desulfovibrio sp.]|nr:MBL fold metallo-hydrolase [Desulfovibrio sp.]